MKRKLYAGSQSVSLILYIQDTTSTTGSGLTGLTASSGGLVCKYRRQGSNAWTTISLSAGTLGTWSSGGFIVDSGAAPGTYELGLPDAVVAGGSRWVAVQLYGATNMAPCNIEIELDAVNYQSPNAFISGVNGIAPPANWNLTNLDASGRMLLQATTHTGAIIPQVSQLTDSRMAYLDAGISTVGSLVASAILVNPLNKIYTNVSNQVLVGGISDTAREYIWQIPESTIATNGTLFAKFKGWNMGADGRQYITSTQHTSGVTVANVSDKTGVRLHADSVTAVAVATETRLVDENDGTQVLEILKAKISSINPEWGSLTMEALTDMVVAEIERVGGTLSSVFQKTGQLQFSGGNVLAATQNFPTDYQKAGVAVVLPGGVATEATAEAARVAAVQAKASGDSAKASADAAATNSNNAKASADAAKASADEAARPSDVQVTVPTPVVDFSPIINPTLTNDQNTKLDKAALAADELTPLIENGAFTVSALANAPAAGGASGGLTPDQNTRLIRVDENISVIRTRQNEQVPEPTPVVSIPQAVNPAKAVVRVCTADFVGIPLVNTKVTLTLVDTKTPVIGDIIRSTRFVEGMTDEFGEVDLEVWSDATLIAAKLKPTYKLNFASVELKIRVPPEGGLASRLQDPLG